MDLSSFLVSVLLFGTISDIISSGMGTAPFISSPLPILKLAITLDLRGQEELVIQGVMLVVLVDQPKGLVNLDLMDHLVAPLIQAVMLDPGQTIEIKVLSLVMTLIQLVLQSPGVIGMR